MRKQVIMLQAVARATASRSRSAVSRGIQRSPLTPSIRLRYGAASYQSVQLIAFVQDQRQFSSTSDTTGNAQDALDLATMVDSQLADAVVATGSTVSSESFAVVQTIQSAIDAIHTTTGLPWWATLALTGVGLRAVVFPFYIYQIRATQRLMQAKPDFSKLYSAYKYARTFLPANDTKGHIDAILLGRKGVKTIMKKYNTRPLQTILGSLVHIPIFILFAYSARDMIRTGNFQGLETGGFLYWINLKETDATFLLPALAAGSTYLNLELTMQKKSAIWTELGQGAQYLPILALPFLSTLPQGVFFYWLGSSWAGMLQTVAMSDNSFRKFIGLTPRITLPTPTATTQPGSEDVEQVESDVPTTATAESKIEKKQ